MEDQFPLSRSKEDIGFRLKLTRQALAYNQAFIAKLCDITPTAWNNYEKGIRRPQVDEVFKMVSRLHLPIGWIYDGDTSQLPGALLEKIHAALREDRELSEPNSPRGPRRAHRPGRRSTRR
jgi:transcriptional regulator with XRE-family HTH domain